MGRCMGYIGWRAPQIKRPLGEPSMESLESNREAGEIIWPKSTVRQRLTVAGARGENDPALLTCNGACGKQQVKWTWHIKISSAQYKCNDCSNTRRWGLGFSY